MHSKTLPPRHRKIKKAKVKKNGKSHKIKTVTYKGAPKRWSADFSTETFQARRDWHEIFKMMKSNDLHPRLLYPAKISLKIEGEIKSFPDPSPHPPKELKEFVTTKSVLQEMLEGLYQKKKEKEEEEKEEEEEGQGGRRKNKGTQLKA